MDRDLLGHLQIIASVARHRGSVTHRAKTGWPGETRSA
jgi:hypothetical protein